MLYRKNSFFWVREWDGSRELVNLSSIDEKTVRMMYADGTVHLVSARYVSSVIVAYATDSDLNP